MKIDKKSKSEQIFVLSTVFWGAIAVLGLTGCSSSCSSCAIGEGYTLLGTSSCSPFSCDCDSCHTVTGCLNSEKNETEDEGGFNNMIINSIDIKNDGCMGSNDYSACYIGTGDSCGNFGITCGSAESVYIGYTDIYETNEVTFSCYDGEFNCGESNMYQALLEIYNLLGFDY